MPLKPNPLPGWLLPGATEPGKKPNIELRFTTFNNGSIELQSYLAFSSIKHLGFKPIKPKLIISNRLSHETLFCKRDPSPHQSDYEEIAREASDRGEIRDFASFAIGGTVQWRSRHRQCHESSSPRPHFSSVIIAERVESTASQVQASSTGDRVLGSEEDEFEVNTVTNLAKAAWQVGNYRAVG